jgi:uncharacterized protein (UPF0216 family)
MGKDRRAQQELAFLLFMAGELQKDIAARVKISERTIGLWIKKEGWNERRAARTITRGELINKTLATIHDKLEAKNVNADELIKLASAIEKLDKKNSPLIVIDTFIEFGHFLKQQAAIDPQCDMEFIKKVTRFQDAYVSEKINIS